MRTSLNVPDDVLAAFDETWRAQGLDSRSRAVREAMREYVESHEELESAEGEVVAVLAYDYEHEAVIGDLHVVQHEFGEVITATSHVHRGEWCLETAFCQGPAEQVRRLAYRLRDFDAVARVKVMVLGSDRE
ncbi:ribbon-helix-helix protein, CopG family (plasmid) [Halorussus salilacus]|uniref:CopG family ribbon-helix-helix protein n=1 Tax=Halorussus salilacus TaxID=2953750 RepID=UPI00209E8A56|nr:ribbon-helix-helix protein, CopG family [Halorussus salilacus]USZ69718.1 ribbon-helix-helix protein, CopG family [Halorussus salilacus]